MELAALNTQKALEIAKRKREPFVFFDQDEVQRVLALGVGSLPFVGLETPAGWESTTTIMAGALAGMAEASFMVAKEMTYGFALLEPWDESRAPIVGIFRKKN